MASIVDFSSSCMPSAPETLRLVEVFLRVSDPVARQRILAIVEALADESDRARVAPSHTVRRSTAQASADILAICRRVLER